MQGDVGEILLLDLESLLDHLVTLGDIAFHQGSLSNQSNGCVHLSWDASETFFDTLAVGDAVYVWGAAPY